ncbi:MAG: hypothetical protein HYU56_05620 [Candidatus Aenigmarchaeota archaeon]|nr:hypothetical protein [Candidatus Aenigmarchaeota archaeon]
MKLRLTYFTEPVYDTEFYRKHGTRIQKKYPSLRLAIEDIPDGISFILEGGCRDVRYAAAMIYDFCMMPAGIDGDKAAVEYAFRRNEAIQRSLLQTRPTGIC